MFQLEIAMNNSSFINFFENDKGKDARLVVYDEGGLIHVIFSLFDGQGCKLKFRLRELISCLCSAAASAVCF